MSGTVKTVALVVLALLVGYGAVKAWPLLSGPSLSLASPEDFGTSADGLVLVAGIAKHTESLTLNGGPLLIETDGRFETTLLLPSGGTILSLTASDRFGRVVTLRRTVYVP